MTLLLALVLAVEPVEPAECRSNADCVISTFAGCCGSCCPVQPYATTRETDASRQRRCAVIDCAAPVCGKVKCDKPRPASSLRAVCEGGRCVAVASSAQCRSDADCRVDWVGDACCPEPVAAPVSTPARPRPLVKKDGKAPAFGLTQGGTQQPSCRECPTRPTPRATCVNNACVLAPGVDD